MTLRGVLHASTNLSSLGSASKVAARGPQSRSLAPAAFALACLGYSSPGVAQTDEPPPAAAPAFDPPPAAAPESAQPPAPAPSTAPKDQTGAPLQPLGLISPRPGSQEPTSPNTERLPAPLDQDSGYLTNAVHLGIVPDENRRESLKHVPGLSGATGLMRTQAATTGAPGTFRLSMMTGLFSGTGFLCPGCPDNNGEDSTLQDTVDHVAANLFLSATPADFLEIYAGIYSHSTATNRPTQQIKQVVGDWTLGAKALVLKPRADQVFSAGGSLELGFATGSGQVGITGIDSVNLGLRALVTADLNEWRENRLPVRIHANLGYLLDNSSGLVDEYEAAAGVPIDRVERFSLDINRVDSVQFALGAEATFDAVRPFVEWSIDIPENNLRGQFVCSRNSLQSGDSCLRDRPYFSTAPSRLTLGTRLLPWELAPWWMEGVAVVAAADIGTGGVSDFLVEVAPELPWSLWLGISLASNTTPQVTIQQVQAPAPPLAPPPLRVHGIVVEKDSDTAIADALIRFDGRDLTGLISTPKGDFMTSALEPGLYTFRITAEGYQEGTCSVEVLEPDPQYPASNFLPSGLDPNAQEASADGASIQGANADGALAASRDSEEDPSDPGLRCELEPMALVSNVNGRVQNVATGAAVGTALATITDVLGRQLELQVDEVGAFRFQNVPPGAARILLKAEGFLPSATDLVVEAPLEIDRTFALTPVPEKPSVHAEKASLRLDRPIVFSEGSAELTPSDLSIVQEIAALLISNQDLGAVEVQGYSATSEGESLSSNRASAVRDALILHGVPNGKLTSRGYGSSQPSGSKASKPRDQIHFTIAAPAKSTPLPF